MPQTLQIALWTTPANQTGHLRSTGPHQSDTPVPLEKTPLKGTNDWLDDQQSSGESDTVVPEVLEDGNDMIVEMKARGE